MHAVGLSSLTHNKISHLFLLFFVERKKTVRANSVSFLCILQLCLFSSFPSLPSSYRVFSQFSLFGFIALLSSHFSSPSPLSSPYFPHLLSLPLLSLLPLFRLCKVQLGFGAFGLQAWRQEDALSEYALLGSLCVTLYFFALLFYLYLLLFNFFPPIYPSSHSHPLLWVFFFGGGRPAHSDIISALQKSVKFTKKTRKVSWVDMNIKLCGFRSWNLSILVKQTSRNNVFTLKKVVGA